jgi:hypothetical protein
MKDIENLCKYNGVISGGGQGQISTYWVEEGEKVNAEDTIRRPIQAPSCINREG